MNGTIAERFVPFTIGNKSMYFALLIGLGVIFGQKFSPFVAATLLTIYMVVGSAFIPSSLGYGAALLGTIPLSVVFFPLMLFFYTFIENRRPKQMRAGQGDGSPRQNPHA
jgi:hypothetical protein